MQAVNSQFQSLGEIEALVSDFETTSLPRSAWDHRAHLTVAAWYLLHDTPAVARRRTVRGIKRYNAAHGIVQTPTGGYHETLTRFWIGAVDWALRQTRGEVVVRVNTVVSRLRERKRLVMEYYRPDELFSQAARRRWLPPTSDPGGEWAGLAGSLAGC